MEVLCRGDLMKTAMGKKSKEVHCILLNKDLIYCRKVSTDLLLLRHDHFVRDLIRRVLHSLGLREKRRLRLRWEN